MWKVNIRNLHSKISARSKGWKTFILFKNDYLPSSVYMYINRFLLELNPFNQDIKLNPTSLDIDIELATEDTST